MVTALQTLVTRRFDVFDPVVLTVGVFHAGTKRNIIPDDATFDATVRSFSPAARDRIRAAAVRLCEDIADAHGLRAEVRFEGEYPLTVNNATEHEFVADTVRDVFGDDVFKPMANPVTGSEDFSRVLEEVPGAYVFLGASKSADPEKRAAQPFATGRLRRLGRTRRRRPAGGTRGAAPGVASRQLAPEGRDHRRDQQHRPEYEHESVAGTQFSGRTQAGERGTQHSDAQRQRGLLSGGQRPTAHPGPPRPGPRTAPPETAWSSSSRCQYPPKPTRA